MFTQVLGFVQALDAIIAAADVSPALIMEGLKNSFVSPLIGLVSILIGALFWAILQGRYTVIGREN
jgi:biopolymer transport protein ExbB/TolQ